MPKVTRIKFTLDYKSETGFVRYIEMPDGGPQDIIVGTLYLRASKIATPDNITVSIEEDKHADNVD